MKITKSEFRRIFKEQLQEILKESKMRHMLGPGFTAWEEGEDENAGNEESVRLLVREEVKGYLAEQVDKRKKGKKKLAEKAAAFKCQQCGEPMNPVSAVMGPVCGKCARDNQKQVTGASKRDQRQIKGGSRSNVIGKGKGRKEMK